jgi:hypothetical protein
MKYHPVTTIQFLVGLIKLNPENRYNCGTKVTTQAPQSSLYTGHSDLKVSADQVIAQNLALKTANDGYHAAIAAVTKARTALGTAVLAWDGAFDVYLTTAGKYCLTPDDAASLALTARGKTKNPLAMPLAVLATWNPKKDWAHVHVTRAPGMDVICVEMSPEPITATSWKELDGSGAIRSVPNPAAGTWWFRAASRTARAKSDYTTPVSLIVK